MRYPLHLALRRSRRILTLVCAIHAIAALALLFSAPPILPAAVVLVLLVLSAVLAWRQLGGAASCALVLGSDGVLRIDAAGGGDGEEAHLLPGSTDFGWALWLQWRNAAGRSQARMRMPDSLVEPAHWPALRTWLRHLGRPSG